MSSINSPSLSKIPGIVHGFLDKSADGSIGQVAVRIGLYEIKTLDQVHSNRVVIADGLDKVGCSETQADALISTSKGNGIGVYTADCVPILLASGDGAVVAAVHAGWKGTLGEIVLETLEALGVEPGRVRAAIGPCIASCCYEVGADVAVQFTEKFDTHHSFLRPAASDPAKSMLDLREANLSQLRRAGVTHLDVIETCTRCSPGFNSYRREGKGVSAQLSFIGIV